MKILSPNVDLEDFKWTRLAKFSMFGNQIRTKVLSPLIMQLNIISIYEVPSIGLQIKL
uniref:Uncharacterized protein n=1 Tax=Tetranychus urticae TaxID=32264 RepID=T1JXW6_TETUR